MKKLIGIIIASSVLVSAGSIYANVDPATKLSNWYDHSFQKESEKLGAETADGLFSMLMQVQLFIKESKASIDSSIVSFTAGRVKELASEMDRIQNDTKNRLDETVSQLKKENFDNYAENANIEEQVEQDIENILEDVLYEKSTK
ncbi:MAG: hypothetical protein KKF57_08060 [Firmicutes bacterium]|nr:hypothetical protein [Bacillota bacterium]